MTDFNGCAWFYVFNFDFIIKSNKLWKEFECRNYLWIT